MGAATLRLVPMLVRRGAFANSAGVRAGVPNRFTDTFIRASPSAGTGGACRLFKHLACDFSQHVGEGDRRKQQVPAQIECASGTEDGGVDVRMNVGYRHCRIEDDLPARPADAHHKEVGADWRGGIGPRLEFLRRGAHRAEHRQQQDDWRFREHDRVAV